MSGAETFRVSRVRPSHLTPPLHVRGIWRDMALLLPLRCPLRRWLARLLLRLLLPRYQCQLYQELVACDVFVAFVLERSTLCVPSDVRPRGAGCCLGDSGFWRNV